MISNDRGHRSQRPEGRKTSSVRLVAIVVGTKSAFTLRVITIQPGFLFDLESLGALEVRESPVNLDGSIRSYSRSLNSARCAARVQIRRWDSFYLSDSVAFRSKSRQKDRKKKGRAKRQESLAEMQFCIMPLEPRARCAPRARSVLQSGALSNAKSYCAPVSAARRT